MRADAELAVATLARGSPFRPNALLLLAISHWLAGEIDRGRRPVRRRRRGGPRAGSAERRWRWPSASAPRSRSDAGRGSRPRSSRTGRSGSSAGRGWRSTPRARSPMRVAARVALHRGGRRGAQELLARAQRLRPRLTYALPYLAVQTRLELARAYLALADAAGAETMLREIEAILRRRPDLGTLPAQVEELRASLKTMHARRPRGLDPDRGGAAPAALPRHAPLLPRDRRASVPVAPHGEITRHGHLPQAQRQLPQRRGRTRPRARTALVRMPDGSADTLRHERSSGATRLRPIPRSERSVIWVLAVGALDLGLEQFIVIPILPAVQEKYAASLTSATWLLTGFLLAAVVAAPTSRPSGGHVRKTSSSCSSRSARSPSARSSAPWLDR